MTTGEQRQLVENILKDGKVESKELASLRQEFGDGRQMTREQADILAELFKRVERKTPGFDDYFYRTIENYVIGQGTIDAELAGWLRRLFLVNGACGARQRKALHEIKGQLKEAGAEFATLFHECMKAA